MILFLSSLLKSSLNKTSLFLLRDKNHSGECIDSCNDIAKICWFERDELLFATVKILSSCAKYWDHTAFRNVFSAKNRTWHRGKFEYFQQPFWKLCSGILPGSRKAPKPLGHSLCELLCHGYRRGCISLDYLY